MKINCSHGYFKFEETKPGQFSDFVSTFGFEIVRSGDHFTFEALADAPDYSLAGGTFLGVPTTETYEGPPWEVMRENGLVYNFSLGLIVPILTVVQPISISQSGNFMIAGGMIIPGSIMEDGKRVTDYSAFYLPGYPGFKYGEISYV